MPRLVTTTTGIGRLDGDVVSELKLPYPDLGAALADGVSLHDVAAAPTGAESALSETELRAPVPHPTKIWAVGWAYHAHREEVSHEQVHDDPFIFLKAPSAVAATRSVIRLPAIAPDKVDYEGELVIVIGKEATDVAEKDAVDYIAGFTIGNDVSARDVQKGDKPGRLANISLGKSFDTFAPMGPCITTLDEFDDFNNLELKTIVDGDQRQHARTSDLIYPIAEIVAYTSAYTTLVPGDIIMTGTPSGVGRPQGLFLKDGSSVQIEIEGIGVLENTVALAVDKK
jgi:2-keto-4-pentenoate hydratase/2-oxohepta-3-ene-1,7-dioic acid hydratase in catechol pathway